MATASISLTAPSPADLADMIERHFQSLLPAFKPELGYWEAYSKQVRAAEPYIITAHRHEGGPIVRRCSCKATRLCAHLILVERMTGGKLVDREKLYISYDVERFNSRYANVFEPEPAMRPRRAS